MLLSSLTMKGILTHGGTSTFKRTGTRGPFCPVMPIIDIYESER